MTSSKKWKLTERLHGIYVLAVTPFREDGALDEQALADNIEGYLADGAHGIVVGGTYAEYPSMTQQERLRLFAAAASAVNGRAPLVCCTAASGTDEAVLLSREARRMGADAVMVTPPYVAEARHEDIVYHFKQLAEQSGIPLMIYNSTSIGLNLTPEQLAELAAIPGVVTVKQANTELHAQVRTMALSGGELAVFCGSDGVALGALALGFHGVTSTLANVLTKDYVELYALMEAGKLDQARRLFYSWQPIRDFCRKHGQPAAIKTAMNVTGRKAGPVRAPFRSLDGAAEAEFKQIWATYEKERNLYVSI